MRFETKTLKFDIVCLVAFIVLALVCFTAIPFKGVLFGLSVAALIYFGIYRNHNYTEAACVSQGQLNIDKGKETSNIDVEEQTEIEGGFEE